MEQFGLTVEDARTYGGYILRASCANGHLHVAQWLTRHFGLTAEDARGMFNFALVWSRKNGHLKVVHWLKEEFGLDD